MHFEIFVGVTMSLLTAVGSPPSGSRCNHRGTCAGCVLRKCAVNFAVVAGARVGAAVGARATALLLRRGRGEGSVLAQLVDAWAASCYDAAVVSAAASPCIKPGAMPPAPRPHTHTRTHTRRMQLGLAAGGFAGVWRAVTCALRRLGACGDAAGAAIGGCLAGAALGLLDVDRQRTIALLAFSRALQVRAHVDIRPRMRAPCDLWISQCARAPGRVQRAWGGGGGVPVRLRFVCASQTGKARGLWRPLPQGDALLFAAGATQARPPPAFHLTARPHLHPRR